MMDVASDNASAASTLSLTDARGNLREVIDEVVHTGGEVTITSHGKPSRCCSPTTSTSR